MGGAPRACKPRMVRGGRSARYDARRSERGTVHTRAPEWSDAAAEAVLQTMEESNERVTGKKEVPLLKVARLLGSAEGTRTLIDVASRRVGAAERPVIQSIVHRAHQKVSRCWAAGAGDAEAAKKQAVRCARSFLKPLRSRRARSGAKRPISVPAAKSGPMSFHCWLGQGVQGEQVRDTCKSQRMLLGLSQWPLSWLDCEGVVCYERALGRVRSNRWQRWGPGV